MLSYGDGLAMAVLLLTTADFGPAMADKGGLRRLIQLIGLAKEKHGIRQWR